MLCFLISWGAPPRCASVFPKKVVKDGGSVLRAVPDFMGSRWGEERAPDEGSNRNAPSKMVCGKIAHVRHTLVL
jgi:hypothetical protein